MVGTSGDLRTYGERRRTSDGFRILERRSGFDRRRRRGVLVVLRDNPLLLLALLVLLNLFSAIDWALTLRALRFGAVEGNLLLGRLMTANLAAAGVFKAAVVLVVSLALWSARRYRLVLATGVSAFALFALLVPYHLIAFVSAGLAR
jgi:hypothetical protein